MKLLVCGSSVVMSDMTSDDAPKTWVYYLQQKLDCKIVNIARAGCGNQYMHDAVLAEVTERHYDLVLVSWNIADRVEVRTNLNIESDDWALIGGNPHYEYMQRNWMWPHTTEELIKDKNCSEAKNEYFKARFDLIPGYDITHQTMLTQVLSLQSTLKQYCIPYMFTFYRKLLKLSKFDSYYKRIDFDNILDESMYRFAKNINQWDSTTLHPTSEAHAAYATIVHEFLSTKNLIWP
jgi:hypothetical protein